MTAEQANEKHREGLGISLVELHNFLLSGLPIVRVLEVGCNIGNELALLRCVGNFDMYGLEPQYRALALARNSLPNIHFVQGYGFDIPFGDNSFDLIFTSGVLIHIAPDDLHSILREIYRCSARYIMGYEYYADHLQQIKYRGHEGLLWKMDYELEYLRLFPRMRRVKQVMLEYKSEVYGTSGLINKGFVLEKAG